MAAGIMPFLPGLSIFRGLTLMGTNPSAGLLAMVTAAAIAIGLSSGAILGEYLAQPIRREARRLEAKLAGPRLVGPHTVLGVRGVRRRRTRKARPTDLQGRVGPGDLHDLGTALPRPQPTTAGLQLLRLDVGDQHPLVRGAGEHQAGHRQLAHRLEHRLVRRPAGTARTPRHNHVQAEPTSRDDVGLLPQLHLLLAAFAELNYRGEIDDKTLAAWRLTTRAYLKLLGRPVGG